MISYTVNGGRAIRDYRGLSADTKPTDSSVPNGSTFYEMDTGDVFMWDAQNRTWLEQ